MRHRLAVDGGIPGGAQRRERIVPRLIGCRRLTSQRCFHAVNAWTPTCKPSEGQQKAMLDRVLVSHDDLASLELSVRWHCPLIVFDHALLTLQIQHSLIGTGFGGACRPGREAPTRSRCQVNLWRWRGRVSEWSHLVHEGLKAMSTEHQANPLDPFENLKRGELLADSVAQALAPKHVWKPGDTRRAFGFA